MCKGTRKRGLHTFEAWHEYHNDGLMAHGIGDRAEKKEAGWDLADCREEPGI